MDASVTELRFVPQTQNALFSGAVIAFQVIGAFLVPVLWAWSGWAFAAYLLAYGYATIICWLLIHEAVHYKLLIDRKANDRLGRVNAIFFGCPFHILKIGHMTHHRYNRSNLDTTEFMPSDTKSYALWWLAYYARILGGLYVTEVVSPLVFFFWKRFKHIVVAWTKDRAVAAILDLFTRRMVQAIQFDAMLCVAWLALQVWLNWSALAPLVVLLLWRGFIVSFYDNAYHYGTDPHDPAAANNLAVPRFVKRLILNHNLHRVHHRYPLASWALLTEYEKRDAETYDGNLVLTALRQLQGPMRRPEGGAGLRT
ncbi:hypothetical protein BH10PSE7_BH10PSE7_41050 [soil metagenome]